MKTLRQHSSITDSELCAWLGREPGKLHGELMCRIDDMLLEIKQHREDKIRRYYEERPKA